MLVEVWLIFENGREQEKRGLRSVHGGTPQAYALALRLICGLFLGLAAGAFDAGGTFPLGEDRGVVGKFIADDGDELGAGCDAAF